MDSLVVLALLVFAIFFFLSKRSEQRGAEEDARKASEKIEGLSSDARDLALENDALRGEIRTLEARLDRASQCFGPIADTIKKIAELRRFKPELLNSDLVLLFPGRLAEICAWADRGSKLHERIEQLSPESRLVFEQSCLAAASNSALGAADSVTPLMAEAVVHTRETPEELGHNAFQFGSHGLDALARWTSELCDISRTHLLSWWQLETLDEGVRVIRDSDYRRWSDFDGPD